MGEKKLIVLTPDMKPLCGGIAELISILSLSLSKLCRVTVVTNVPGNGIDDKAMFPYAVVRLSLPPRHYRKIDRIGFFRVIRGGRYRWLMRRNAKACAGAVLERSADHVLLGTLSPMTICVATRLLQNGHPYSVFLHGLDLGSHGLASRNILDGAQNIFVNSRYTANLLSESGVRHSRVNVVYPPLNTDPWLHVPADPLILNELGLTKDGYFLSLGRTVARKGFDSIIRVLPEVLKHYPTIKYVICGLQTDYLAELKRLACEGGVADSVVFYEAPAGDFARRKALLMNSLFHSMPARKEAGGDVEGFGISYLEAALFEKPSIAGREGGCAEAVVHGETGAVINGEDSQALESTLKAWLSNPILVSQLGARARERVLAQFDSGQAGEKIYNEVFGTCND